jgi:hypothetical protein
LPRFCFAFLGGWAGAELAFRRLASIRLSEVIYFLCLRVRFAAYSARRRTVHFKLNSVHDAIQVIPAESEISTEWVCFHNPTRRSGVVSAPPFAFTRW